MAIFDSDKAKDSDPLVLEIHTNDAANREINSITIAHNIKEGKFYSKQSEFNTSMEIRILAEEEEDTSTPNKATNSITPIQTLTGNW